MTEAQFYKLSKTPSGRELWTYMAAILEATGMDKGKVYPLKRFIGNFKTHLDNGRIRRVEKGYQVTQTGIDYFRDRYSPNNKQHIERLEVEDMLKGITTGVGPGDWEPLK
ncbi:hypothetical protein [Shewanella marisflavi]|uniref:hypothetical protein n=1 Tax=Shewanella marisflavi TaxID=260364 RepID=UPI003AAA38E7